MRRRGGEEIACIPERMSSSSLSSLTVSFMISWSTWR